VRAVVGDVEMSYELTGNGPPVVLVAGTGYPGRTWLPAAVAALAAEFTVVTFDHRGTGDTAETQVPYSTRLFAADALGLVDSLGLERVHVIGHSMGGRVAQWMALDAPERVRTLVLAATGAGRPPSDAHQDLPAHVRDGLAELGYQQYMSRHQRETFFNESFARKNPDVVEWLDNAFWSGRPKLDVYVRHVLARQGHNTVDLLSQITQPTLVLVGSSDDYQGGTGSHVEQSRFLATHIPNAKLVMLPGMKHGYFWERPAESMAIVAEWLAGYT